jgi:hypothetical protein
MSDNDTWRTEHRQWLDATYKRLLNDGSQMAGVAREACLRGIAAEITALAACPDAAVIRQAIRNVVDADPSVWLEQGDMADAVAAEYVRLASLPTEPEADR